MAMTFAQTKVPEQRRLGQLPEAIIAQMGTPFGKSPFGGFEREKGSGLFTPQRKASSRMQIILDAWKKFGDTSDHLLAQQQVEHDKVYRNAAVAVVRVGCTPRELVEFFQILPGLMDARNFPTRAGFFTSALINIGNGTRYVMQTDQINGRIDYLGYRNAKELIVIGRVCHNAGFMMEGGRLVIKGTTREWAGSQMMSGEIVIEQYAGIGIGAGMKGGKLTAMGNTGSLAGYDMDGGMLVIMGNADILAGNGMNGGEIIVHGDASGYVGHQMNGGLIRINGSCGGIGDGISRGQIFVKGRQIYPHQNPVPAREVV